MEDNNPYKDKAYIFGEAIQNGRNSMQKSTKEFALLIGIDEKHLEELERGNALPSFPTQIMLRKVLGISIDKLFDEVNKAIKNETD